MRIFEQLATGCPTIAAYISIHNMVAWMIDRYGDDGQRADGLPRLAAMEALGSYCLTEPGAGSDAAALRTRAERDGDHYVLNGVKQFISGAGAAAVYVVMARTAETGRHGICAFIVPDGTPGLRFGRREGRWAGTPSPPARSSSTTSACPSANRLGAEGDGFRIAMNGLNGGRLNIARLLARRGPGARSTKPSPTCERARRSALGCSRIRRCCSGWPTWTPSSRPPAPCSGAAADALDRKAPDGCSCAPWPSGSRTDAGFKVANAALQLHGGYGYLADYGIEKIVRDLRVHQILEGTNEIMRVIVGRELAGA